MHMPTRPFRLALLSLGFAVPLAGVATMCSVVAVAQTPTAPARATPQRGTVTAVQGNSLHITTDGGQQVVANVADNARIQRLAPGSTDLKTAETATFAEIAVGDRVLVAGAPGDTPDAINANRVILMKSGDIAQRHEAEQQDWQRRGTGGIVTAIAPAGVITIASGAHKIEITTSPSTTYRRYADGSVKFEDAKAGSLSQIAVGDQLLALGNKSASGDSVQAEEVVSGDFKNLAGTIVSIDAAAHTIKLKDLATKKDVTVQLSASSAIHRLPEEAATRFAARAKAGAGAGAGGHAENATARTSRTGAAAPAGGQAAAGGAEAGEHTGGGDASLSRLVARLPAVPLSDLHTGEAVMIVAEQSSADASALTAITLLAGVEPILAAAPSGSSSMTLSPWNVGSGAPDTGAAQ